MCSIGATACQRVPLPLAKMMNITTKWPRKGHEWMQRWPQEKFAGGKFLGDWCHPAQVPAIPYSIIKSVKDVWTGIKNPNRIFAHKQMLREKNLWGVCQPPLIHNAFGVLSLQQFCEITHSITPNHLHINYVTMGAILNLYLINYLGI